MGRKINEISRKKSKGEENKILVQGKAARTRSGGSSATGGRPAGRSAVYTSSTGVPRVSCNRARVAQSPLLALLAFIWRSFAETLRSNYGVTYLKGGVFVPALSQPITRGFERPMVGATPIEKIYATKSRTKKAFDHSDT